jgi:hypothetical protein
LSDLKNPTLEGMNYFIYERNGLGMDTCNLVIGAITQIMEQGYHFHRNRILLRLVLAIQKTITSDNLRFY